MRPRVALATYARLPDLPADDRLLIPALAGLGIDARPLVWDAPEPVDGLDAVVIRSCWNYHLQLDRFVAWLDRMESGGARVINPAPVLRWNADKSYLLELGRRGVPIVPTHLLRRGATLTLSQALDQSSLAAAVIKPAVSASAHATWRVGRDGAGQDEQRFRELLASGDVLLQPLVPEVVELGEWSVVCFGGEPSHAVLKRPATGDWRVQGEFGGSATLERLTPLLTESAVAILAAAGARDSAYARVDGCLVNGRFVLMELELIEPQLFLDLEPRAPARFASAIAAALP